MVNNIKLLIKKNLKNEIRSWKPFLYEIGIVLFMIIFLSPLQKGFDEIDFHPIPEFIHDIGDVESLKSFRTVTSTGEKKYNILYTPDSKAAREIINAASKTLGLQDPTVYSTKYDMVKGFDEQYHLAAVSFDRLTNEKLDVGIYFPGELRSVTGDMCKSYGDCSWLKRCLGVYNNTLTKHVYDIYEAEGFLPLQHQIFKEWIKFYNATVSEKIPEIRLHSFFPQIYFDFCYDEIFHSLLWFFYNFVFCLPFLNLLWRISREFEEDMPRHYSVYGFSRNQHWIAHLVTGFLHLFVLEIFIVGKLLVTDVPSKPAGIKFCFFMFILFYNIILLLNVFILSTLVRTAKLCVLVGASWWVISYCIFSEILTNIIALDVRVMIILLIFTNHFMPFGMGYFTNDFAERIWDMLALQIFVIVVYGLTLKCVEHIRWGKRIRHDWDQKKSDDGFENANNNISLDFKSAYFEYGPVEEHVLALQNVWVYQNHHLYKAILKDISIKFHKNEISVIVGPRNSGKTTLIKTLAGWQLYHGQMYFEEVTENTKYYSEHIVDVSMVENALIDLFKIEEQLYYVILIKTPDSSEAERRLEVDKWLLILRPFIAGPGILVKNLNYDQKRLLTLCCLLCGKRNSRIILLDEPTRYLTSEAQKAYWRILTHEKLNRFIIMTSDSIEEAEEIGDRIGILYNGNLMAWGTSFFLRSNLCTEVYAVMFTTSMTSVAGISKLLEKYVADIKIHNQFKDRVVYKFPSHKKPMFQKMLIELEKEFISFGIQKVYMTSGELSDIYGKLTAQKSNEILTEHQIKPRLVDRVAGPLESSVPYQISALFYKKLLYQAPNYVPVVILMLSILLIMPLVASLIRNLAKRPGILIKSDAAEEMNRFHSLASGELLDSFNLLFPNIRVLNFNGAIGGVAGAKATDIWINEKMLHSAGKTLNLAHNIILQDLYPNNANVHITVRNEPIWIPEETHTSLMQINQLKVLLTIGVIMPLTMSSFILTLIDERRDNIDVLQRVAGVTRTYFWLTHIVWDYIVYWIIVILYILILSVYTIYEFSIWAIFASLFLLGFYGIAYLLLVYVTFLKSDYNKWEAFFKLIIAQTLFGITGFQFYRKYPNDELVLYDLLIFSPTFALLSGMANVSVHNSVRALCQYRCKSTEGCNENNACSLVDKCCYGSYFQLSFPGILGPMFFMLLTIIILAFIFFRTIIEEERGKYSIPKRIKEMTSACYPYDTESVLQEKTRISKLQIAECKGYAVLADQLEYEIPETELCVKAISFALEYSKCMGVYGPAASGKSHLIKQLVGSSPIRFGAVYMCGYVYQTNASGALRKLGYSPENNGYIEGATTRQLLTLFLRLSGTPTSECYGQLQDISQQLNLRQYINKRISELPLHIKRRINIAIALVVSQKVLIFDEPTRGMPSTEISYIRSVIRQARQHGNAVILASQDSRELEELTDFIIMVDNGELLAIGSVHSIRQLYTKGLYLEIHLYTDGATLAEIGNNLDKDIENLHRFINFLQSDSELIIRRGTVLKFYLPIETVMYSFLFGSMEKNRERLNIKEYIVTHGSLATAYNNLQNARKQQIRYGSVNAPAVSEISS